MKKYIMLFISIVLICILGYFYALEGDDNVYIEESTLYTTSITTTNASYFFDIKGAVNNPGVYSFIEGEIVLDAINKAGGLKNNATTININLSKKLTNEMVIYVYTYDELTTTTTTTTTKTTTTTTTTIYTTINAKEDVINVYEDNDALIEEDTSLVNINEADIDKLLTLPGIGESKAKAIIEYRANNGNFKEILDIKNVSGIGDSLYEKIKDYITV